MKRLGWISQTLALISLSWCVVVGFRIWFTPVRYTGITVVPGRPDQHTVAYSAFADVSSFGPLPLIIPTLIAIAGAWAAWRGARVALGLAALLLAAFAFVTGFSIGGAYILPAGLLLLATLFAARVGPMRRSQRGAPARAQEPGDSEHQPGSTWPRSP
jgi:hypothetical protein